MSSDSSGLVIGRATPSELLWNTHVSGNWNARSVVRDVNASLYSEAWVRGGPGTPIRVDAKYRGRWQAYLQDDPPGYTGNAGVSITAQYSTVQAPSHNDGFAGNVDLPLDLGESGIRFTAPSTRYFAQFPGQVYSLADFDPGVGVDDDVNALISGGAGEICIIHCGPNSAMIGTGELDVQVHVELAAGVSPVPDFQVGGGVVVGTTFVVTSTSTDPDNTAMGDDGIIFFEWFVNGLLRQSGLDPSFVFVPDLSGIYAIRLQVTDDEGMLGSISHGFWIPPAIGTVDLDSNWTTDLEDYRIFCDCLHGPQVQIAQPCVAADVDRDGDSDLLDFAGLQAAFYHQ